MSRWRARSHSLSHAHTVDVGIRAPACRGPRHTHRRARSPHSSTPACISVRHTLSLHKYARLYSLSLLSRSLRCFTASTDALAASSEPSNNVVKVKLVHTRLPSVGFPELIPVLASQPTGDVSHKPGGRLPLLSTRPAVTPATLKRSATNFAAW